MYDINYHLIIRCNLHQVAFPIVLKRASATLQKSQSKPSQKRNSSHILFVDDNKINLLITKKNIESLSVACDTVDNGHDAIQKITTKKYSLILMDLNMPDIDGFETTQEIKKLQPSIPIVAHTVLSNDEVATKCSEAGMYDILTKPMQKVKLKRILKMLLILESN